MVNASLNGCVRRVINASRTMPQRNIYAVKGASIALLLRTAVFGEQQSLR